MTLPQVLGVILMAAGILSLLALLYQDATKKNELTVTDGGIDWGKLIGMLPARYLPSVVTILLGYALYDPSGFKMTFGL